MKTIKYLSILALTILLLASCKKTGYENCIPADATLVVSVDMYSLSEKADLKNSHISDVLDKYLGLVVFGEGLTKVKDYMEKPETIGIDFRDPIYLFKTASGHVGATFNVHDEDLLKEFVETLAKQDLCSKPTEKGEYYSGNLLEDIQYGFDGHKLLLLTSLDSNASNPRQALSQLMAQKKEDSYVSTSLYEEMKGKEAQDIVVYSNFGVLGDDIRSMFAEVIPNGVRPSDIELFGAVSFDKGVARLSASLMGSNPKVQAVLDDFDKNFHKIKGAYTDRLDADCLMWGCVGVNGDWLLNMMKKNKDIKNSLFMMERAVDIEAMIRDIDGDVAFCVPQSVLNTTHADMFDFTMYAQLKTASFLSDVNDWKDSHKDYGIVMTDIGKDKYQLRFNDISCVWGVSDKNLYLSNAAEAPTGSTLLKDYEDEIKDNVVFWIVDLQKLGLRNAVSMPEFLGFQKKIEMLKSFIIKAQTSHDWEIDLELSDKNSNFLESLI